MTVDEIKLRLKQSAIVRSAVSPLLFLRNLATQRNSAVELKLLASLASLIGEDVILKLPSHGGSFCVGTRSDLFRILASTGSHEPELLKIASAHLQPNRDAVDVGANIGLYTVHMASRLNEGQRVLAIEPTPAALRRLQANLAMNHFTDNVIVFDGVASDSCEPTSLNLVPGREEYSSMGQLVHPNIRTSETTAIPVQASTIDALVAKNQLQPGFVKIDVEGMEHRVLSGMTEVLTKHRPVILAELSDPLLRSNGSSSRDVVSLIRSFGYEVQDASNHRFPAGMRTFGEILCLPLREGAAAA